MPVIESRPNKAKNKLGILVLGYNRPAHLWAVLESLRRQERLEHCHVWIDGTQGRGEMLGANDQVIDVAKEFDIKELRLHWGHLGVEKLMLDALTEMIRLYSRVLVLEDDCFPIKGAVDAFEVDLADIENRADIFSVYGHHFGTEPSDSRDFPRFQGWGWAAHSSQIELVLTSLKYYFSLSEQEYLRHVKSVVTPSVRNRLDLTPGRDVLRVLEHGFSWDSATALVTARYGMSHRRTSKKEIFNTGISENIGHFTTDSERVRKPPYNMIPLSLAWEHF